MTIKNIVIVGGATTGWSVASLLAKHLPRELVNVSVVDERRKDHEAVESARSSIHRFHDLIGLHEKQCVLNTSASFSLGVWCQDAQKNYMLAEGVYGAPLEGIDFQSIYYKSVLLGCHDKLEDYSLNAVAARLGRFGHPVADPKSIYSSIQYGLHLELDAYANILKTHALTLGVECIASDLGCVNIGVNDDAIESIDLENGLQLKADLFIDCTGEQSVLLGGAMGVTSVADPLDKIFDSMVMGYRPLSVDAKPVTQLINTEHGCVRITPLRDRECVSYVYSSCFSSNDLIRQEMLSLNVSTMDFSVLHCKKREHYWVKNCIAMGGAGASFYELFVSPMSLVRSAAVRLLDLLADFDNLTFSIDEYNRRTHVELEQLRELTELYFYLSRSSNTAVEDYFKFNGLSASSQHRLDLFAYTGRHSHQSAHILSASEWAALFVGNEIFPQTVISMLIFLMVIN